MFWDVTCDYDVVLLPLVLIMIYLADVVLSTTTTGVYFQHRKLQLPAAIISAHLAFCVVGCVVFFLFSSVMWLWSAKYSLSRPMRNWRLCVGLWAMSLLKDLPLLIIEAIAIFQTGWHDSSLQAATFIIQIIFAILSVMATSLTFSWYCAGFLERNFGISSEPLVPGLGRGEIPYAEHMARVAAAGRPPPLMLQDSRIPMVTRSMSAPISRQLSPYRSPPRGMLDADGLRFTAESRSPYRLHQFLMTPLESPHAPPDLPVRHYGPPPII